VRVRDRFLGGGLLGLMLLGLMPGIASAANPQIVQFTSNNAKAVHGNSLYGTVASFGVGPGRWLVLAKAELAFPEKDDARQITTCTLYLNGGVGGWQGFTTVSQPNSTSTAAGVPSGVSEGFSLSVGDSLAHAGSVLLRCYTGAGANHVFIRQIHITAIKVNKLTVMHMGSGTPTVYGSGTPEAVWAWNTTTAQVPNGGGVNAGSFTLPVGNWWGVASGNVGSNSSATSGYCYLTNGGEYGQALWRTAAAGTPGDKQALTTQLDVHRNTPASFTWQCGGSGGSATLSNTFVAVIRLSRLTQRTDDSTVIYGSGSPSAFYTAYSNPQNVAAAHPKTLTRALNLPAGSYVVQGTVSVTEVTNTDAVVHCKLKVGTKVLDQADTRLTRATGVVYSQALVFNGSVKLGSAGKALLSCYHTDVSSGTSAVSLSLTALQGVITTKP
jgi:hypothetical protein